MLEFTEVCPNSRFIINLLFFRLLTKHSTSGHWKNTPKELLCMNSFCKRRLLISENSLALNKMTSLLVGDGCTGGKFATTLPSRQRRIKRCLSRCDGFLERNGVAHNPNYELDNIFNADEFGLFYQQLPSRCMSKKGEICSGGKRELFILLSSYAHN